MKEKITLSELLSSDKKIAVHCETRRQARILMKIFDKAGKCWENGERYKTDKTNWSWEEEATCYTNDGRFDSILYFIHVEKDYKIVEFGDIILKPTKDNSIIA